MNRRHRSPGSGSPPTVSASLDTAATELGESTYLAAAKRLLPLLAVCYFLSYQDRTNVSVAALTMNEALGISATAFGLGSGLFFIGYFLVEVPSNMIMHKVGARRWIARIMISWRIVAAGQALVGGESSFYLARILLGVMEAGFFPGVILYLTLWFPAAQRARVVGWFMAAVPLSTALGAPVGGLLLRLDGIWGLAGWQWLFIVEGVPTVLVGFAVLRWLTDQPKDASWLTPQQRNSLAATLAAETGETNNRYSTTSRQALISPRVLALSMVYFAIVFGLYGLGFWIPTIIKKSLSIADNFVVTLLVAAPYVVGTLAIIFWGRLVDRRGRPAKLTAVPMFVGGIALAVTAFGTSTPWLGYAGLSVCAIGVMASFPGFWTLPSAFMSGAAAAVGIAVINAIGNLAGFAGPYWVGWMTDLFGDAKWGLISIGVVMISGAMAVLCLGNAPPLTRA
ncbi:MAG: MFS transporter [Pseudonocardiales bacterium]|nr:MFS transporter [Pseudonocardiales bacterium]